MQKVKIISAIITIGFTLSVIFHYIFANYIGLNTYPYSTFLFDPNDRFNDFINVYKASVCLNPYGQPVSVYFPFAYIIMFIHTLFSSWIAFAFFTISFIVALCIYIYKNIPSSEKWDKIYYTFILTFMSYPVLFIIDRGNLEIWLFLSLILFVYFYSKEKMILSALFLSIAISLKLYPAVFGLVFLIDKKYREIFYTAFITLALTVLSMLLLKGGIVESCIGFTSCLGKFNQYYINTLVGIQHNISLFAPTKGLYYFFESKFNLSVHAGEAFNNFYFLLALFLFSVLTYFLFKYKFNTSKIITLLLLSFLILPQISSDYKLINLYIPLILFIRSEEKSKFDTLYAVLFGLLLIPKDYYIIIADISIAIIINPILILLMIVTIIYEASLTYKPIIAPK